MGAWTGSNPRVLRSEENFMSSCKPVSVSGRTLHHEVQFSAFSKICLSESTKKYAVL